MHEAVCISSLSSNIDHADYMKICINKEVIILKGEVFLLVMAPIREILTLIIFY